MGPKVAVTQTYLDNSINDLKQFIQDDQKKHYDDIASLVNELKEKLEDERSKNEKLDSSVAILRAQVHELKRKVLECQNAEESNAQYSRRNNIVIKNIPPPKQNEKETADDCMVKVKDAVSAMGVVVPDEAYDRAHRVGKRYISKKYGEQHSMIVRFTSWRQRSVVYRARKNGNAVVSVDLTKTRSDLLLKVRKELENYTDADYAFADINCNLCISFSSTGLKYFDSYQRAEYLLDKFGGEVVVADDAFGDEVQEDEDEEDTADDEQES